MCAVGGDTQKRALSKLDYYYKYLLDKYESRAKVWKTRLARTRLGSFKWLKYSRSYYRYYRKQVNFQLQEDAADRTQLHFV